MSHRNTVFAEHPQTTRLNHALTGGLRSSSSILSPTFGNSSSTNVGWVPEIVTNNSYPKILRERNHAVIERQLLTLLGLPDEAEFGDVRPTRLALAYAFRLVNYLEDAGLDLSELDITPTDNHTIEFSLRLDRDNELSFETGNNGISGNMYIGGRRFAANAYDASTTTQHEHIIKYAKLYHQTVS